MQRYRVIHRLSRPGDFLGGFQVNSILVFFRLLRNFVSISRKEYFKNVIQGCLYLKRVFILDFQIATPPPTPPFKTYIQMENILLNIMTCSTLKEELSSKFGVEIWKRS